ncbi:MAG: Gfo/Idh/MocA family oxidoreductase [Candidatus Buchananbacteria bacterium]
MSKKMLVGFIGAGFITKFQRQALRQIPNAELVGVYALKGAKELAEAVRADGGDCRVYDSVAELCQNCDVIAIFVPNMARIEVMEQIAAAVKAGAPVKGVICEKPLGRNVAEAKKMVALAREAGLFTAYFENQIFMKANAVALAQLARVQKTMGPLTLVRTAEEHGGPHEPWFWDPTRQGGGVGTDMLCHCTAVARHLLTPPGKLPDFLQPISVQATTALLKWGQPKYREELKTRMGVDYLQTPADDYCTAVVKFLNPETKQVIVAQCTSSWMFDKQGLRLSMEGMGPGYAFEVNTLQSPLSVFIADAAADAIADGESALEKATATRGLLVVQPNEADLYGYTEEMADAIEAFSQGRDGFLSWEYGLEITKLVMACYLAAEKGVTLDLTDQGVQTDLETYISLIAQGKGHGVLGVQA